MLQHLFFWLYYLERAVPFPSLASLLHLLLGLSPQSQVCFNFSAQAFVHQVWVWMCESFGIGTLFKFAYICSHNVSSGDGVFDHLGSRYGVVLTNGNRQIGLLEHGKDPN